ncbi:MAG: glucosamine-6-phosphate deaminase [Chloroflexi bacterium]|nr:glucosamine-6-phosphate deaminase [Chloroflexota bacterium]
MDIHLYPDKKSLSEAAAQHVGRRINQAIGQRGEASIIVGAGASQVDFLASLRDLTDVDWTKVVIFHLDEYLGIPEDHPASFRRFLKERLFDHLPFASVHLLAGDAADPMQECARYAGLLAERVIDVACIGIGENGHLAFNDPPADFDTDALVHIVTLDRTCRQQQVNEGHFPSIEAVPPQALTLTIPAILAAQAISCVVPEKRKAPAVQCALEGPLSPHCPASILRQHSDCTLFLDHDSASLLSGNDVQVR